MQEISAKDFKDQLASLQILDIRTPREWEDFNVGGIHMPLDNLLGQLDQLNPNQPYTIICYNGTQSAIACRLLTAKGFPSVQHLQGGLEAYLSL